MGKLKQIYEIEHPGEDINVLTDEMKEDYDENE